MVAINKEQLKALAIKLHEINALKFGDFEMKVGLRSPVYFDLRVIISHPNVMVSRVSHINFSRCMVHKMPFHDTHVLVFSRICYRIYCWISRERKTLNTIIFAVCHIQRFRLPHWSRSKAKNRCSFVARKPKPTERKN